MSNHEPIKLEPGTEAHRRAVRMLEIQRLVREYHEKLIKEYNEEFELKTIITGIYDDE